MDRLLAIRKRRAPPPAAARSAVEARPRRATALALLARLGPIALSVSACTLLYDLDGGQCQTADDCTALGFAGRACMAGICRVPTPADLGDAAASPDASVDSGGSPLAGDASASPVDAASDDAGPTDVALVSSIPAAGAVGVDPGTNLTLVFGAAVAPLGGELSLRRLSDDHVVEAVPLGDLRVTVSDRTVVVDFDALLAGDTDYYVHLPAGALGSPAGGAFAGLTDSTALGFRTTSVTTPGNVSSGLRLWLDADHAASLELSSGAVATWSDRSGEGNVLRQADGDARPQLEQGALGGKATVSFDGAHLTASGALSLPTWDAFVVWRSPLTAAATVERIMLSNGDAWTLRHGAATSQTQRSISRVVAGQTATLQLGERSANSPHLWNFTYDDAQRRLSTRTNGSGPAARTNLAASSGEPSGVLSLGAAANGTSPFAGELAEVLVFDRVLSATERDAVVSDLELKWGLARTQCDAGEVLGPSDRCHFLDATTRTWSSARFACQQRGSGWDLTAIRTPLGNDFATTLAAGAQVWIGGRDDQPQPEQFVWSVDQSAFWNGSAAGGPANGSYVNWNSGEPNGGSDQADCVRLLDTGLWADYTCSVADFGGLCEGPGN